MTDEQKRKAAAGLKIVGGAYEIVAGAALAAGKGMLGKHIPQSTARNHLGTEEVKKGIKHVQEGLKKWNS